MDCKITYNDIIENPAAISKNDLFWLLSRTGYNESLYTFKIAKLLRVEVAFLWDITRKLPTNASIYEIGRYRGGSTLIIGMAMPDTAHFTSIDVAPPDDIMLQTALDYYGVNHNTELLVVDANDVHVEENSIDLLFIDGDHSYDGVSRDYHKWKDYIKAGGHLIFHDIFDAPNAGGVKVRAEGVHKLYEEMRVDRDCQFKFWTHVGSMGHYIKMEVEDVFYI